MKILVVRFSSIGDIVLTTPVVRCAKQQLKDVEIHYLTKKSFTGILQENKYIDRIHLLQDDWETTIDELRKEQYNLIIDLHNNLRTLRLKKALGIKAYAFPKLNVRKWLYVNFKLKVMPGVHIVDRYFKTVESLGVKNDGKGLDYFIPGDQEFDLNSLPMSHQSGFMAFAIGGQHPGKMLPVNKMIEICSAYGKPVVLLGGKEDIPNSLEIEKAVGRTIYNMVGKCSLHQSASLIRQADVVLTHDTGLMHIAAAFKKKIVSVWGATVPQFGMYPYLPAKGSVIIEPKGVWDRPYSKLGDNKWYKPRFRGMEKISVEDVVKALLG